MKATTRIKKDTRDGDELLDELKKLSLQEGGAWIAHVLPFSMGKDTEFIQFKNRSSVPDSYLDLCFEKSIAIRGEITTFTPAALRREAARGFTNDR